jgi:hypothetical protein
MARKLNREEATVFGDEFQEAHGMETEAQQNASFAQRLSSQRDADLILTPELRVWFPEKSE